MGKYRHVTDLRSFAGQLSPAPALELLTAEDFAHHRSRGNRNGEGPELPDPTRKTTGAILARDPVLGPLLRWENVRGAIEGAIAHGARPQEVAGLEGLWIVVELDDGVRSIPIDDDFEAAIIQREAVWLGNKLCVRPRQPVMN